TLGRDPNHWQDWAAAMLDAPPPPLTQIYLTVHRACPGAWALDVGCGTGRAFQLLAQCGYRILGIDPISTSLHASQTRARTTRIAAWPIQATTQHLPIPDAKMQLVLAIGILFHLSPRELPLALTELRRVVRPEGEIILHFLALEDKRRTL